jgi:phospholipid/cholesterol/gamma-HCH transport system permease protein
LRASFVGVRRFDTGARCGIAGPRFTAQAIVSRFIDLCHARAYNKRVTTRQTFLSFWAAEFFGFFGGLGTLFWDSFTYMLRGAVSYRHTLRQMSDVGVGSLFVALLTVGFSGAVASLYVAVQLVRLGQPSYVGGLVGKSLALEIAPVITAVVVAARSGSAIAAELGSMVVTEQVDALRALATSPTQYLVVPRVLGTVLMLPLVTVLANGAGALGGYAAAVSNGIAPTLFWRSFQEMVTVGDQVSGLIKAIPFALIISLIGCRQGLSTKGGAQGVGRATTSAVVFAMIGVYVVDYFLSTVLQDVISKY